MPLVGIVEVVVLVVVLELQVCQVVDHLLDLVDNLCQQDN